MFTCLSKNSLKRLQFVENAAETELVPLRQSSDELIGVRQVEAGVVEQQQHGLFDAFVRGAPLEAGRFSSLCSLLQSIQKVVTARHCHVTAFFQDGIQSLLISSGFVFFFNTFAFIALPYWGTVCRILR